MNQRRRKKPTQSQRNKPAMITEQKQATTTEPKPANEPEAIKKLTQNNSDSHRSHFDIQTVAASLVLTSIVIGIFMYYNNRLLDTFENTQKELKAQVTYQSNKLDKHEMDINYLNDYLPLPTLLETARSGVIKQDGEERHFDESNVSDFRDEAFELLKKNLIIDYTSYQHTSSGGSNKRGKGHIVIKASTIKK